MVKKLDQTAAKGTLHNGINGLLWGGPNLLAGTNIVVGLNGSSAHFATGLGDRVDPPYPVPNIVVFITDGDDTAGNSNGEINVASTDTEAEVFVVGVGADISSGTMNSIASQATSQYSFSATDYSSLPGIVNDIFASVSNSIAVGTLFTIESVSADGTVSISEVVLPPE
ncbi:MAG: VWA domain-containing protein [Chloroflexi bacterium]|nr:VWA domain-containing protein [Chloroflexota bacterium]